MLHVQIALCLLWASLISQLVKNPPAMQETLPGSIPGLGRSCGEENSYPFQYSGLENSMQCIVHGTHFRLPMRIADQCVYLTFHLCNANFSLSPKDSVPVRTQQHYINISRFHMTSNSWCFQAFKIFDHLGRVQSIT